MRTTGPPQPPRSAGRDFGHYGLLDLGAAPGGPLGNAPVADLLDLGTLAAITERFHVSDGGAVGNETFRGGGGGDLLLGGAGADVADGGEGNDVVGGCAGADRLVSRSGADTLDGGAGNDVLDLPVEQDAEGGGGLGADTLNRGFGGDTASCAGSFAAVGVDLTLVGQQGGAAEGDVLRHRCLGPGARCRARRPTLGGCRPAGRRDVPPCRPRPDPRPGDGHPSEPARRTVRLTGPRGAAMCGGGMAPRSD